MHKSQASRYDILERAKDIEEKKATVGANTISFKLGLHPRANASTPQRRSDLGNEVTSPRLGAATSGSRVLRATSHKHFARYMHAASHTSTMASAQSPICIARSLRATLKRKRPQCVARRSIATHTHSFHADQISVLRSNVDTGSAEYKEKAAAMDEVLGKIRDLRAKIALGGTAKAREKHVQRGKMLVRE